MKLGGLTPQASWYSASRTQRATEPKEIFPLAGNLEEGEGGRKYKPCSETEQESWSQISLVPTRSTPDDSHDRDRDFQELPPMSSVLLNKSSRPGSMPW